MVKNVAVLRMAMTRVSGTSDPLPGVASPRCRAKVPSGRWLGRAVLGRAGGWVGLVVRPDRRRGRGGGPPEPMAVRPFRAGRGPKLCAMAGGFGRPETKSIAMGDDENRLHVHGWSQTPESSPWMTCLPTDGPPRRARAIIAGFGRSETKRIAMGDDENRLHVHGWSQTPESSPRVAGLPPDGLLPRP